MKLPGFIKVRRPDPGRWLASLKAKLPLDRLPRNTAAEPGRMVSGSELLVPVTITLALTLLVMASAMAVIFSAYEYRRLFNQHQVLVQQWDEIQVEWGQYLLEQSLWSAHHRVEALAADEMNMVVPATEAIEIVRHEQR
jgi:cell division protein FtsL